MSNVKDSLQIAIAREMQENHESLLFAENAEGVSWWLHVCTEVMRDG